MSAPQPVSADLALHALMQDGEIFEVGHGRYLVAPVNDELIEILIVALAATEDDEHNGDIEPSIGTELDLESDGDCDAEPNGDEQEPNGDEGDYSLYSRNIEDRHYIEAARTRLAKPPCIATDGQGRRWRWEPIRVRS
jgi:hypothetical protein